MAKSSKDLIKPVPNLPSRGFGYQVIRLAQLLEARAEAVLAPLDLKPRAYDAMICIVNGQGMSQQDLSRKLGLYAPQMVGLLDGLEKQGVVERQVSSTDRRRRTLSLTAHGRDLLGRATTRVAGLEMELFGSVSDEEKSRFEALVRRLEGLS